MSLVKALPLLLVSLFLLPLSAFSAVSIESGFEGTLVITTPEGEINLYEPGDALPEIKDGSIVEVFDGSFTLSAGANDNVRLACLEHEVLAQGGSAKLSCGESTGSLNVLQGSVSVTDPEGTQTTLNEGQSYDITLEVVEEAEATAEGRALGLEVANDAIPADVDPTGIDIAEERTDFSPST